MSEIEIDLSKIILGIDDIPLKDTSNVEPFKKDDKGNLIPKSPKEQMEEGISVTIGRGLVGLLLYQIKPENQAESAKLNRVGKAIQNRMKKNNGIWKASETEIQDILKLLEKVTMKESSQTMHGEIVVYLEDKLTEYRAKPAS